MISVKMRCTTLPALGKQQELNLSTDRESGRKCTARLSFKAVHAKCTEEIVVPVRELSLSPLAVVNDYAIGSPVPRTARMVKPLLHQWRMSTPRMWIFLTS